jgi:hypothetical protein
MLKFEIKHFKKGYWKEVSEQAVFEILAENFSLISPMYDQLLAGKNVLIKKGICRLKKEGPTISAKPQKKRGASPA